MFHIAIDETGILAKIIRLKKQQFPLLFGLLWNKYIQVL